MNLKYLKTFVVVGEAGGFAAALPLLNLSQPAASRQIQALEAELGVKLFDRTARGVRLTSAGEDFLRRSRHVLAEAAMLLERGKALRTGDSGLLRVGATPQVIESTLAPFLRSYRRRYPGVDVELWEDGGKRLPDRLHQGDVHILLTNDIDDEFVQFALYPVCMLVLSTKAHRFNKLKAVPIEELANEPLLVLARSFASREWFDIACSRAALRPRYILESRAPQTIIALAAIDQGVGIVPSTVIPQNPRLRIAPLIQRGRGVGKWLTIGHLRRRYLAPYAEAFIAELRTHCQHNQPGRELFERMHFEPQPKSSH